MRLLHSLAFIVLFFNQAFAEECCDWPVQAFGEFQLAYEDFRGIPEGSWNGNTGALLGANVGMTLWDLFGIQAGGSYGLYDWAGRSAVARGSPSALQQQGFATGGLFRKALCCKGVEDVCCCDGFQLGAVVDWMFNRYFGVFGLAPSFGQVRYQAGYLFNGTNELGFWGAANINSAHKTVYQIPVFFRAISQVSLFWRHIFYNFSEMTLWGGVPYRKSLLIPGKREGQYVVGVNFRAPFTDCLSLDAHGVYMGPVSNSKIHNYLTYNANVTLAISYAFPIRGSNCCKQGRPYLPLANNSNFLVDTNLTH